MSPAYQGWLIPGDSRQLVPVPLADQSPHFFCGLSYSCHCSRPNHQGRDQGAGDTDSAEPSPSTLSSPVSAHRHGNTHKAPSPFLASLPPGHPVVPPLRLVEISSIHPSFLLQPPRHIESWGQSSDTPQEMSLLQILHPHVFGALYIT